MLPTPDVSFTPTSKSELPSLQRQLTPEHVETVTSSITASHCLYTDGFLQVDGVAGGAVFSLDLEPPPGAGMAVVFLNTPAPHCVNCMPFWMLLIFIFNVE
ncbi:hypothetical protein Pcinc_012350 [Petrolisthes cinctipes]|uniref:Uncharacterized protein n=1 Tax=Petrolisthes cinctipes TaxID=88211 RepID=A0AAE1KSN3_PETCI|nr:hypothetical protein Pcinc_012350 [Petrolisthes cinctipes]